MIEIFSDGIGFRCVKCPKLKQEIKAIKCYNCKNFGGRFINKERRIEYTKCNVQSVT
jgi:hypothetical protein